MIAVSPRFLTALRWPHQVIATADLYPPGGGSPAISGLPIQSGSLSLDRTADTFGSLDLTLAPELPSDHPDGPGLQLYPRRNTDPLNVYGSVVILKLGLQFNDQTSELVQVFRGRVNDVADQLPFEPVSIKCLDRSGQMIDERFATPRTFTAQTAIALLTLLVREVFPTCSIVDLSNGSAAATTIPKHVVDADRWPECQRVGKLIGCDVYFDELGQFVVEETPDPQASSSAWRVNAQVDSEDAIRADPSLAGVLVTADRAITRSGAPNAVAARGESAAAGKSAYGFVSDTSPTSPTRYGGPYGKVVAYYSSPLLRTNAQAVKAATKLLRDRLGASRSVSFESVPNPALRPGDAIQLDYPDGSVERHVLDAITIPIDLGSPMSAETRAADLEALS